MTMLENAVYHAIFFMALAAHAASYLRLRHKALSVALGLFLVAIPYPVALLWLARDVPVNGHPYFYLFFIAYMSAVYWRLVFEAGFKQILFVMFSVVLLTQMIFVLSYMVMVEAFAMPVVMANNVRARLCSVVVILLLIPFCRIWVRPRVMPVLEAVERQQLWFICLLGFSLFALGNSGITLFVARRDPLTLRSCLIIVFCVAVFYYTVYRFVVGESANQRLKNQVEASEQLVKTYEFYDAELKGKEQAIRTLRHDFRHMLLHLEALMEKGDHAGVVENLQSLAGRSVAKRPVPYCENMTVNTLTTYHFAQADEKGIACAAKLFVPARLAVPTAELAVILGNALENSLRGAESMGDVGYISFSAMPARDCIVFDIENNYRPGGYRKGSGVGLSSIKTLCEKNGGRAEVTDEGGIFKLNIVLRLE